MRYARPCTLDELASTMREPGARIIAGGTDVMVQRPTSGTLVDITRLDLRYVRRDDGRIRIGALTTYTDLIREEPAPILRDAARTVGGTQIRNMGTVGGNVANASPAGDLLPPLYVLEAVVHLNTRDVPIEQFIIGPRRTVLQPGEFIREISFAPPQGRHFFVKVGPRVAQSIAIVSIAYQDGRVAIGSCAPTVVRARGVEATRDADRVHESISPIDDIRASAAYRRAVVRDLLHARLRG